MFFVFLLIGFCLVFLDLPLVVQPGEGGVAHAQVGGQLVLAEGVEQVFVFSLEFIVDLFVLFMGEVVQPLLGLLFIVVTDQFSQFLGFGELLGQVLEFVKVNL